ncbi:hypothetical protein SAMN06297251_12756 [Fulvimarina manganoxydans]|uniref:Uncharacterized protein n=1 Tax=Fulvimarina manganoxydans TaxID=937218 RepID=A0A1W2EMA2_9HYPH|nr:hypothetical protein SAMN06297251_12756 [Fulvimarina manganoxydans]
MTRSFAQLIHDARSSIAVVWALKRSAKAGRTLLANGYPREGRKILNACRDVSEAMKAEHQAKRSQRRPS